MTDEFTGCPLRHSEGGNKNNYGYFYLTTRMSVFSTRHCITCTYATSHSYDPHVKRLLSSSHLLGGEGETVWKRETWRKNRDTRKEDRYAVLEVRESRPLEERLFDNNGCLWRTRSTPNELSRLQSRQSRGESTNQIIFQELYQK